MKKGKVCMLVVDDSDMNCESTKDDISKMTISNVGFSSNILDGYEFVIYNGTKGCKVLKSSLGVKTGIIA